jgi:phosphatidylglycerol:prolipoprotein diacylglycerol transferase
MRPILISIPSKLLFAVGLLLALAGFVRDLIRRRGDRSIPFSSTPLYLAFGAGALWLFKSGAWTPIPIYAYGVMLGTSMIVGWFLAMRFAKQDGVGQEAAAAIYMWTAVYSLVGARVLYVITNFTEFRSLLDIFKVWQGGMVAYGGMIGGFLASWYGCHKRKIPLLQWADVAAPAVVLGTAITRIGCFLFGCDYGARSDLPWAVRFPKDSPAWHHHVNDLGLSPTAAWSYPLHPTQLYESLVGLALFGLLMFLRRHRRFSGQVFLGWVLGYGVMRPLIEILRDDDQRGNVGPLSTSQFIGIVSVVLGAALLVHLVRRYRRDPEGLRLWQRPAVAGGAALAEDAPAVRAAKQPKRRKRR